MNGWNINTDQADGYATGLLDATRQLSRCINRLGDALGVERFALDELCDAWTRQAEMVFGFSSASEKEADAAEEDPDALAAAVAADLHLRPNSALAKMQAGLMEAGRLAAVAMGTVLTPPQNQAPAEAGGAAAAQSEAQAASPSGVEGPAPNAVWTEERMAMLTALYPTVISVAEILQRLNTLPGPTIASIKAVGNQAYRAGIFREGKPEPTQPPPLEEDIAEARQRIREGQRARWIADEYGWSLDFAQRLCAEVDAEPTPA